MTAAAAVAIVALWTVAAIPLKGTDRQATQAAPQSVTYVCPMHQHVRTESPGLCPICGMTLVTSDPLDTRDYRLEMTSAPPAPLPNQPARLRLTVRDPDTNAVVRTFATVHEKIFHLFIVSHDLEHYAHVHPEQMDDGSFAIDVTLPRAGYYKVYSDFLPSAGTPQVIPRLVVTKDFDGGLASSMARLVPDAILKKGADGMDVELLLPETLVAGREEKLTFRVTDRATGAEIRDLEPYLGAWGHSLVMSEDTLDFVHAHPLELLPDDAATASGGPMLTFKALLPKAGNYRVWMQIKHRGEVSTAAFTLRVSSPTAR